MDMKKIISNWDTLTDTQKKEAEAKRVAAHEAGVRGIIALSSNLYTLEACKGSLLKLDGIDPDTFEEFKPAAEMQIKVSRDNIALRMEALEKEAEEKRIADEKAAEQAKRLFTKLDGMP